MLEQNYINISDKGRYGFSESGKFRAPFKNELIWVTFFKLIFIFGTLGGIGGAYAFVKMFVDSLNAETNLEAKKAALFIALVAGVIIALAAAASFVIYKVGTAYTKKGFECSYSANEEVFTVNVKGSVSTIKYSDVIAVSFSPRSISNKIHGYDIDIALQKRTEHFSLNFDGEYQSEKTTPFYIIKKRVEMRNNRLAVRQSDETTSNPVPPQKTEPVAPQKPEPVVAVPLIDEMPAVSLGQPTAPLRELPKLSPTVDGYAAEYAQIAEGERLESLADIEQIKRSRELDEKEIVGQGSFYIGFPEIVVSICTVFFAISCLVEITFLAMFIILLPLSLLSLQSYGFLALIAMIMAGFFLAMIGGTEYRYSANAREFSFSRKNGKGAVAHFFYKDILSIDYCPHKILWIDTGYYVTIETKSGFFTYKYIFPRFRHAIAVKNLPFEVIRERINPRIKLPEQKSVRIALSAKKLAVCLVEFAACAALGVLVFILPFFGDSLFQKIAISAVCAVEAVLLLRKIRKGDEYRCRADDKEFIIRRANGNGKTVKIPLEEVTEARFKRGVFIAKILLKTKTRTLKFKYILPKIFRKHTLADTPFAIFPGKGDAYER